MKDFPNSFCFSVSHTTRKPRAGEVDGVNYHFIIKESFLKMINEEEFIEFNIYNYNYYGTSKTQLQRYVFWILMLVGLKNY
jgi:guanylate kinase